MSTDLSGEVAVVTGVSGRLGAVWATCLLEAGADVVGLDVRENPDSGLEKIAAAGRYLFLKADVTDRRSLDSAGEACLDRIGPPSILINNAGVDQPPSEEIGSWLFEDLPDALSEVVFDVNALGVLRVSQVFGAEMARRGRGSVVNIGSLYGIVAPDPRLYQHIPIDPPFLKPPAYGMSKAGVTALTRYLAALWGPAGVRVNTLAPGGVLGGQDPTFQEKFTARVPLGRMAVAEDLTGPLLFLASDMSRYLTGQELVVDGGYTCW
ncbi:SDR family oxidoreductase [Nonomuraea sp. NPDC046570]|uniref:SDR family oxidoreductase n=1 Tax=Nonomuraea sp. NPDC046570 TaxID=3155255 RepID=UPI0033C7A251